MRRILFLSLLIPLITLVAADRSAAVTLHVPTGHETLQEAVNASADGDTILIAPGDYFGVTLIQGKGSLILIGREGPEKTFMDGDEKGSVLEIRSCTGTVVVRGLTFQRGYTRENGGGLLGFECPVEISDCHFINNSAVNEGGGLMLLNCPSFSVSNCRFERNESEASAAFCVVGGRGVVTENVVTDNTGGLTLSLQFSGCSLTNNVIYNNLCTQMCIVGYLVAYASDISGNTIVQNLGNEGTGAIMAAKGDLRIERNLVCFNEGVCGIQVESSDRLITLRNNNLYENEGGLCAGMESGEGDISADPLFCDIKNGDFRLKAGSPCLPTEERGMIGAIGTLCP